MTAIGDNWLWGHLIPAITKQINPEGGLQMPILRPTSSEQPNQDKAFHQSVSSQPMAMSMMIDSMVNMMQNNRPALDDRIITEINNSNEY